MKKERTIAFHTLGCKLNFAETSAIGRQLTESGYIRSELSSGADVLLLNTCSVTENADRECKTIINKALRVNPSTIVVVTGCYAQLKPEAIAEIPGVDLVLGANEKFNAPVYLESLFEKNKAQIKSCEISEVNEFHSSWSAGDRTRTFLKVQDGCDYNCSFCTIPLARGASRSNTIENVIAEAGQIVAAGIKEIVLTGVNLGDFGIYDAAKGIREHTFYDLAKELDKVQGLERIRISSIEPNLLEDRIIEMVSQSEKFVPHFHIPLQSGSDVTLKKMRRRYLTALYSEKINKIRALMPHCCIGVDVIVGFPGESEKEFMETYNFLRDLDISYLHVFTYSERDDTLAASLPESVPVSIRKERNKMLRILSDKKLRAFYEKQVGTVRNVLFEADNKSGWMHGFTDNYIKVRTPYNPELINRIAKCRIESVTPECEAEIVVLDFVQEKECV